MQQECKSASLCELFSNCMQITVVKIWGCSRLNEYDLSRVNAQRSVLKCADASVLTLSSLKFNFTTLWCTNYKMELMISQTNKYINKTEKKKFGGSRNHISQ